MKQVERRSLLQSNHAAVVGSVRLYGLKTIPKGSFTMGAGVLMFFCKSDERKKEVPDLLSALG